jgi:Ca-activated chloride channel family protein
MTLRCFAWYSIMIPSIAISLGRAQSVRSLVNGGNDLYKDQKYGDAEVNYRKALEKEQGLLQGKFNLGNALYKQGKFDEAVKEYDNVLEKTGTKDLKAESHFNVGNSLMKQQKYQEAAQSYIESLKLDPNDQDAKYNLSYALRMLRQQQQQQQQQNKDKKNQDKKQDQNKNDQQQQNQQDQQKKQQQNQQQNQQQKQDQAQQRAGQQEKKMSKADAERILDVLKNNERDVQKKLRVRQAVRPRTERDW